MTLKLKTTDTFKTRIDVVFPSGEEADFVGEFKYLGRDQLDDLLAEKLPDADFVERVLVGTKGITNDTGEVDFPTAMAAIRADIALCTATTRGYLAALGGAPAKNSRPSRGR